MYEENECAVCISTWCKGIAFRVDDPKTQDSTSRSLRNGREIDMIKYRGLIYEKVALRLRNIEFRVTLFDRGRMCAHLAVFYTKRMHLALQASYWLLLDLWVQNDREKDKVHRNKSWVIKVLGTGTMSLVTLRNSLRPLVKQTVVDLLGGDDLKMKLQGRYPKGWEAVFHRCVGQKGFDAAGIDEDGELVPDLDVEDYFDFIAEQDYFWDSDFTANGGWAGSAYAESETFTNLDEFDEEDDDDSWDGSDE